MTRKHAIVPEERVGPKAGRFHGGERAHAAGRPEAVPCFIVVINLNIRSSISGCCRICLCVFQHTLRTFRVGAHRRHLFAVRSVDSRTLAARKAAHQRKLTAVMDAVRDDHVPEDGPDRCLLSVEER